MDQNNQNSLEKRWKKTAQSEGTLTINVTNEMKMEFTCDYITLEGQMLNND